VLADLVGTQDDQDVLTLCSGIPHPRLR